MNEVLTVPVWFEEADLLLLVNPERDVAIDALTSGKEYPFVIVGETLACAGELDFDSVLAAVQAHSLTRG